MLFQKVYVRSNLRTRGPVKTEHFVPCCPGVHALYPGFPPSGDVALVHSQGQWNHWVTFIAVAMAVIGLFQSASNQEEASNCSGSCSPETGPLAGVWAQGSLGSYPSSAENAQWLCTLCADRPTKTQLPVYESGLMPAATWSYCFK